MDSLTQIVLGAAVGEAVLGKKAGARAALWGGICGTIPDLDVVTNLFMGEFDAMASHRGVTHSIAFSLVMAPVLGWLIHRLYARMNLENNYGSQRQWSLLAFWALFTHPLLDCFTTWGTQLFYPFSHYRVALNSIFVVDPAYTLPFMICLIVALVLKRHSKWRRIWNGIGIGLSSFYLILTILNKLTVSAVFTNALHEKGRSVSEISTYPTPLNNLLWYAIAEEPSGYSVGFYSLLGNPNEVSFNYIPKNHQLIAPYEGQRVIEGLKWISKGQYSIEAKNDTLLWKDLRFGFFTFRDLSPEEQPEPVFINMLVEEDGEITDIRQKRPDASKLTTEEWKYFWDRMMGK